MKDQLFHEAKLGIEAETFAHSDLGKYLIGRAEEERGLAIEKLLQTPAHDTFNIERLQAQAWRADSFQGWLAEAIQNGFYAEEQIKVIDDE